MVNLRRQAGIIIPGALILAALLIAFAASLSISSAINVELAEQHALYASDDAVQTLLRNTLDQETGLRGYVATGQPLFLQPYTEAVGVLKGQQALTRQLLEAAHISPASMRAFARLVALQTHWSHSIAAPSLRARDPRSESALQRPGKAIVDQIRAQAAVLLTALDARARSESIAVDALIVNSRWTRVISILVLGSLALVFAVWRASLANRYADDRRLLEQLRRSFVQSVYDIGNAWETGAAYAWGSSGLSEIGDVLGAWSLPDGRAFVFLADTRGAALEAARDGDMVRFTLFGLCARHSDPARLLTELNERFRSYETDRRRSAMVFVAFLDPRTRLLHYAAAGHGAAFVCAAAACAQLAPTGPAIGIEDEPHYSSAVLPLPAGDRLLLASDALLTLRNAAGEPFGAARVEQLIRANRGSAQRLADGLLREAGTYIKGPLSEGIGVVVIG